MPGSGGENGQFLPQLTSYDYDAPISEAGASGQPGIGGPNKFHASTVLIHAPAQTAGPATNSGIPVAYVAFPARHARAFTSLVRTRQYVLPLQGSITLGANSFACDHHHSLPLCQGVKSAAQLIQSVISNHTGNPLPEAPASLPAASYGAVSFNESGSLLAALPTLYPGDGIPAFKPASMESYGQP